MCWQVLPESVMLLHHALHSHHVVRSCRQVPAHMQLCLQTCIAQGCGTECLTCAACLQGRGSGVNFALPVDLLRTNVPNLIVYGNASGKT